MLGHALALLKNQCVRHIFVSKAKISVRIIEKFELKNLELLDGFVKIYQKMLMGPKILFEYMKVRIMGRVSSDLKNHKEPLSH